MALPTDIEPNDQYEIVVNKVIHIANHQLRPQLPYVVKGKVLTALISLDEASVVSALKVGG